MMIETAPAIRPVRRLRLARRRSTGWNRTVRPTMVDADVLLAAARRPLVIGMGGGGDVVGALATADRLRRTFGAEPVLGGVSWERRAIDPQPGPRSTAEIAGVREVAPYALMAGPRARVRSSGVRFAEGRMAELLGEEVLLVDPTGGPAAVAQGLGEAIDRLECDATLFVDVGGDVLAHGEEPGLGSPLCDAVMLAAAVRLVDRRAVLGAVFGVGCDGELTVAEVLDRLAAVGAAGGLAGAAGIGPGTAEALAAAVEAVPTEASAQALRAFHGATGTAPIRRGEREVELSPLAALTFFFDVGVAAASVGRLARAVADSSSLEAANEALHALGVRSELDLERERAGVAG